MAHDLVVRGGTVVDGTGAEPVRADVAVDDGRIVEVGDVDGRGEVEIDAEGHLVTPGFIDGHTHLDAQVCWDPMGTSASWHGVTTAVMGNCGFTLAPCRASESHLALRSLERAEDMSAEVLAQGVEWRWETYREYLDVVDALPKGINHAGYVGHSALRTYVMGERAFTEAASDADLAAMASELGDALHAGAIGFTTSRSPNHETSDDRPVASRLATWDEVRGLVGVMGELGVGVFELANEQHRDPDGLADYHRRLRDLAVESGRPITFIVGAPPARTAAYNPRLVELLDATAAAGGTMFGQAHVREFQAVLSFETTVPFDRLPGWKSLRSQPLTAQLAVLSDPELRAPLVAEALAGDYGRSIGAEVRPPDYDWIRIADTAIPPYRTVAEVAAERRIDPVTLMIELAIASNMRQLFFQPFGNHDQDAVLATLRHRHTVVATSDTGAHVSQIADSSIPTYLLGHWVRERQALTVNEAIHKLTGAPAAAWGFTDRGVVAQGAVADLNVIDPATVGPALPEVAHDLPTGAVRLTQRANGMAHTIVAGVPLLADGHHTGALPGRLLRGPLAGQAR